MQKLSNFALSILVALIIFAAGFWCGISYDRNGSGRIPADYNRIKTELGKQADTIRSLEASQQADRGTISDLRAENNRLRDLAQQQGDIIAGIEAGEETDSDRLGRLEAKIRGMSKAK